MKFSGGLLILAGIGLMIWGYLSPISLPYDGDSYGGLAGLGDRVANFSLMAERELVVLGGVALFVSGVICYCTGVIVEAITARFGGPPVVKTPPVEY